MKQEYWNDLQSAAVSQNIREHNDERERKGGEKYKENERNSKISRTIDQD